MLISNSVKIKISNKNVSYYKSLNYNVSSGDIVEIDVNDLPKTSKLKILVKCDNCLLKNSISYYSYLRNIQDDDIYYCKKCSNIRFKETCVKKYGVEHPMILDIFKEKQENTNLEKYGVKNSLLNDNIKNKSEKTLKLKYGNKKYMKTDDFKLKSKQTMIEKYGVEIPIFNDIIKEKIKNTNIERYGCKFPFNSEEIMNKISNIKFDKYGDENYNNREKYIKTCLNRYGVENPMQNENIRNKLSNIIFEKYGVYYPAQNRDIYNKMIENGYLVKEYKNTEIFYQGEYEYDFLSKFYKKIEIKKHKSIKYIFNDKECIYYPDFYFEKLNLIIEIKSSYWYEYYLDKNLAKEKACKEQGYNFIFIIDKDYSLFNKLISRLDFNNNYSWQYNIRLNNLENDIQKLSFDHNKLIIKDFKFEFIDKNDSRAKDVKNFIEKYEWLGKMPNRPTHRFIAIYNNVIAGAIVLSTPNSFSKMLGDNTHEIEKLISRGACASWTPKNLASSLIMWSIRWMVNNTNFRVFEAYGDTEAKELGTIYQACNFYYLGKKFGSNKLYLDPENSKKGWVNNRGFRKMNFYKSYLKSIGIDWNNNWNKKTKILWNNIPDNIINIMKKYSDDVTNRCFIRKIEPKHKYVYILGKNKGETRYLRNKFLKNNKIYDFPKER